MIDNIVLVLIFIAGIFSGFILLLSWQTYIKKKSFAIITTFTLACKQDVYTLFSYANMESSKAIFKLRNEKRDLSNAEFNAITDNGRASITCITYMSKKKYADKLKSLYGWD